MIRRCTDDLTIGRAGAKSYKTVEAMDQQTKTRTIPPLDLAMAEALYVYDIASKHDAPALQSRMLRLIAHLRAAQKAGL